MATVQRTLQRSELRILAILGVPTFALALAITTVSTYLPVLAEDFSDSSIVIGLLIGGEGLIALWLPLVVGSWSDRLRTPLGSRLPFILAATPGLVVALAVLGFVDSIAAAAIVVAVFFVAYFVAYEPYRALYPDLVDDEIAGRAQSSQAIFRGLGTFLALVGGGLLISISDPLPFLAAALVVGLTMGAFCVAGVRYRRRERPVHEEAVGEVVRRVADLVRGRRDLHAFLVANALWELALSALKTFVVLYVTETLGLSLAGSSLAIGVAATVVLVGALVSGKLGDSLGRARDARRARRLRARPAGPVRQHRPVGRGARGAARRLRRRRDDVAALRPAHADDAARRPRRRHRPVLAQPRRRDVAGPALGRRRHPGGGRGLPLDLARVRRGDPRLDPGHGPAARGPVVPTDWPVSQ
ncbi:MAG: MFS transporter [Solirubrobacteraceae bacterium]